VRSSFFSTQRMAATTGVYVAAVVPVICGAVAGPSLGGFSIATVFGFGALVYVLSLALGALFGLPVFMLLARLRLVRWWAALIGGFVIGALIAALLGLPHIPQFRSVAIFGSEGATSALVFWLFWLLGPEPTVANARGWVRGNRKQVDGL
jgi:hypothetical protein